jgi:hypothetical protein
MELTNDDVTLIKLIAATNFREHAKSLFETPPGPRADQMMRDLRQLCERLPVDSRLKMLTEVMKRLAEYTGKTDMTLILERARWFVGGAHGRATRTVIAALWEALYHGWHVSFPAGIQITRTLVPGLV